MGVHGGVAFIGDFIVWWSWSIWLIEELRSGWSWFWCSMGCIPWSTLWGVFMRSHLMEMVELGHFGVWWRCSDGCLGGTHFGMGLKSTWLSHTFTFDDAWRMSLLCIQVAHGLASWTACWDGDGEHFMDQKHGTWMSFRLDRVDRCDSCRRND